MYIFVTTFAKKGNSIVLKYMKRFPVYHIDCSGIVGKMTLLHVSAYL